MNGVTEMLSNSVHRRSVLYGHMKFQRGQGLGRTDPKKPLVFMDIGVLAGCKIMYEDLSKVIRKIN